MTFNKTQLHPFPRRIFKNHHTQQAQNPLTTLKHKITSSNSHRSLENMRKSPTPPNRPYYPARFVDFDLIRIWSTHTHTVDDRCRSSSERDVGRISAKRLSCQPNGLPASGEARALLGKTLFFSTISYGDVAKWWDRTSVGLGFFFGGFMGFGLAAVCVGS